MDNNKIGKTIASLRKKKNLTQQELGNKLFVTDKAVSKWERGLSLPDITILEKLSQVLDSDIYEILQIENKNNIDIEKLLKEEKIRIKRQLNKKTAIISIPIILFIFIILFKLLPFGYNVEHIRYLYYDNKLINLGIPKFSFMMKNNENIYSYKSFRGKSVLKSEIKNYVNTLEHISCNNTVYYYDPISKTTIIDYSIVGNLLYNTISYNIRNGNYCNTLQIEEYAEKLGILNGMHTLYSENSNLIIQFFPTISKVDEFTSEFNASMNIYYMDGNDAKIIERSYGTIEIKEDILTYYRVKITEHAEDLEIPNVSNFIIKEHKLILQENYLDDYEKSIILQ